MNSLHGHIAVVAGAGSGVGQAIAYALAARATLCLVGRTLATLEATACGIHTAKVATRCYPTDLTHDGAVQALAEQLQHEWAPSTSWCIALGPMLWAARGHASDRVGSPIPHERACPLSNDASATAPAATATRTSGLHQFACRNNSGGAGGRMPLPNMPSRHSRTVSVRK